MIALISFSLLGIWMGILGIRNSTTSDGGCCDPDHNSDPPKREREGDPFVSEAAPKINSMIPKVIRKSELADAFRDLWNEILSAFR